MKQLIHILRKDIRYLWSELLLFAAFLGFYVWTEMHPDVAFITLPVLGQVLLPICAAYLIVRLIHAEAIPGHNQFWVTRPYRWWSLLGAKLAFILLLINLPMFAARLALLLLQGFPLSPGILNLAWSQFVMMVAVSFPLAAIAALTSGLVPFFAALVVVLSVSTGVLALTGYRSNGILPFIGPDQLNDWIPGVYASVVLVLAAGWLLGSQYKFRRSWLSRVVALVLLAAVLAVYLHLPEALAAKVNSWIAEPLLDNTLQLRMGPNLELQAIRTQYSNFYLFGFPVTVTGIPDGYRVVIPNFQVTIEDIMGATAERFGGWSSLDKAPSTSIDYRANAFLPSDFNAAHNIAAHGKILHAHASIDLFLFSPARTKRVRLGNTPVDVIDGLQCSLNPLRGHGGYLETRCRTAVGWPSLLRIEMTGGDPAVSKKLTDNYQWSYSPFPAGALNLTSIAERSVNWAQPVPPEFTFSVVGPPQRFHREIDLENVQLVVLPVNER